MPCRRSRRTRSCWCSTPTISPASRRSRPQRIRPAVRAALSLGLAAAHRAGRFGAFATASRSRCAWHGEAKPFLAAVPDPSNPWTANASARLAPRSTPTSPTPCVKARSIPMPSTSSPSTRYQFRDVVDVSAHLTFLRDFLAAKGVRLAIAYIPYPAQVSDYYVAFKHRFGGRSVKSMSGPEFQVQAAHLAERDCAPRHPVSRSDRPRFVRARPQASICTSTTTTISARRATRSPPRRSTPGRRRRRRSGRVAWRSKCMGARVRGPRLPVSPSASAASRRPRPRICPAPRC